MNGERWQRVQAAFRQAVAAPAEERAALLARACAGDAALRADVESLLAHDERAPAEFLQPPVPAWPEADGPDPLIGTKIGRYLIQRVIAGGGMGTVYEAVQEQPQRTVALKVLKAGHASRAALRRFHLEAELLGRLRHPHIAQIYEAGTHRLEAGATAPYFAMEYVPDARPITQYVQEKRLSLRARLELFARVCDAVHHGHQKGIIHRDLKPANILVDSAGEPKVIDFGVARATDSDLALTTQQTHIGELVGTVQYMSPEQCDADPHDIDTRSNVYSLGVVLYEVLAGVVPYDASKSTIYQAMRTVKEAVPQPLSTVVGKGQRPAGQPATGVAGSEPRPQGRGLARQLRGDLDTIVLKALEKDRDRRYTSAAALVEDIRRYLGGDPIDARPPGPWRRLLRWAGRRPRTAATIGTLGMCGLMTLGVVLGLSAYVQSKVKYLLHDPVKVQVSPDGTTVELLSRVGTVMHKWSCGTRGGLSGQLVRLHPDSPSAEHVLIRYSPDCDPEYAGEFRLYDLNAPDLDRPVWIRKIADGDLPEAIRGHGDTADQFSPFHAWSFDIFPEAQPPRANEVVCTFAHRPHSWTALCIYSAGGELLYRVWHDGGLGTCYWMVGPSLLVVAGDNQERPPYKRGCPEFKMGSGLPVVFALRPERGAVSRDLLDTSSGGRGDLAWYKWLSVCPIPNVNWIWGEFGPPHKGDPLQAAELGLSFETNPPCGMTWCIDADGNQIEGSLSAPLYRIAQEANSSWPAPEEFRLQDVPPGQ